MLDDRIHPVRRGGRQASRAAGGAEPSPLAAGRRPLGVSTLAAAQRGEAVRSDVRSDGSRALPALELTVLDTMQWFGLALAVAQAPAVDRGTADNADHRGGGLRLRAFRSRQTLSRRGRTFARRRLDGSLPTLSRPPPPRFRGCRAASQIASQARDGSRRDVTQRQYSRHRKRRPVRP